MRFLLAFFLSLPVSSFLGLPYSYPKRLVSTSELRTRALRKDYCKFVVKETFSYNNLSTLTDFKKSNYVTFKFYTEDSEDLCSSGNI